MNDCDQEESDKIQLEAGQITETPHGVRFLWASVQAERVRQALLERKKLESEEEKKKAEADLRKKVTDSSMHRDPISCLLGGTQ